ncbi:iron complex transport system ATP-binding protein [Austwickia chelonae]|uniref:Putative ABC transporter ATP-binding protein n=1 Tax=Austwickia chelonae NBRC 105200 TaxID=1184607 RepID=K6V4D2_9MICO|nr:ABC transporter ATP-binding protein [Austwickia chelonae]GAB76983.1 putative ABC transporter ATP-binding protein [Austwickia chelonae NBRC 105200]SEW32994.1 iron complex transport system ATP-binding protein [Austwickia chelonae]
MRLSLQDVRFSYGRRVALAGVSMPVTGGVVGVLGPNGSGKSTLMKLIAGIHHGEGRISVCDADGGELSARRRRDVLGYVPQDPPGDVALTVLESVLVGLRRRSSWRTSAEEITAAHSCLDELGIAHLANRYLNELSGGQRQLAGIAQMTVRRPQVMLLDEPTSALDLHHQINVLGYVRARTAAVDGVSLVPMHDLNLAARFCDQLLIMRDGTSVAFGAPSEVLTSETLSATYRVEAKVLSDGGVPVIAPVASS